MSFTSVLNQTISFAIFFSRSLCCFVLACMCMVARETNGAETEPTVVVRRVVPANFADKEFQPSKFNTLLTTSIKRSVDVKPSATVSGILREQFNISQTWTPAVYKDLEAHVLRLNSIDDPARDLKAGSTFMIPDLPRTAKVYLDENKPTPSATKSSIATIWNPISNAITTAPRVGVNAPSTAPKELQIRVISESALKQLQLPSPTLSRLQLIEGGEYQVLQERMEITMASESAIVGSNPLLSSTEKNALRAFMGRPVKSRPYLVVLDDGYPSQDDFKRSAEFVIKASREIREKFGLQDAAHMDSQNLINLEKTFKNGTLFCDEDCEYPKLKMHSAMIRESLRELTEIDINQRVEVIYLPVNLAQTFSKEIYAEILNVVFLADSVTDELVLMTPGIQPPVGSRRGKPAYSTIDEQIKSVLNRAYLYNPLKIYKNGDKITLTTDKAIIEAAVNFVWLYSMASQRPHFISMSWTSPNLKHPVLFRPNGYGLWVAAAGNDPKINVHKDLRQFAARSSDPADFLAVANLKSDCASSTFTSNPDVPVFGFMFPGRVTPTVCGTSFSAPRVAWFLAAYEAVKGDSLVPYSEDWNTWRTAKRKKLMDIQNVKLSGEARYRVSPWQILEESLPP